jgi:hypothetical protein
MSTLTTTCPAEIARIGRQALHKEWWDDPVYQAIAAKRIEGETCHYCGQRPATLAHHDEDWMYTKEAYYDPQNMTPCCWPCHEKYRRGLVICPGCRKHYMRRDSGTCQYCRGVAVVGKNGKRIARAYKHKHPCQANIGSQRCSLNGVCPYNPQKAPGCRKFIQRVKKA